MRIHTFPFAGLLIAVLLTGKSQTCSAQFNRYGGGLSFTTGVDDPTARTGNPGLLIRGVYEIKRKIFIVPGLTFYMPKTVTDQFNNSRTTWFTTFDVDGQYAIAKEKQLLFYAMAGLNLTNLTNKFKGDDPAFENESNFEPGFNFGTGIEMIVDKDFNAFAQIRYTVGLYEQLVISLGAHYYIETRRFRNW